MPQERTSFHWIQILGHLHSFIFQSIHQAFQEFSRINLNFFQAQLSLLFQWLLDFAQISLVPMNYSLQWYLFIQMEENTQQNDSFVSQAFRIQLWWPREEVLYCFWSVILVLADKLKDYDFNLTELKSKTRHLQFHRLFLPKYLERCFFLLFPSFQTLVPFVVDISWCSLLSLSCNQVWSNLDLSLLL